MKKVILIILDGWGLGNKPEVSAIAQANTPFFDHMMKHYPKSKLQASGLAVGLPEGQMGNSEVGHMNIGAGRIVYQDLVRINKAIEDGTLATRPAVQELIAYCKSRQKPAHLIGLVSDGGVHAHIEHLKALMTILRNEGIAVFVHAFTDGRDTDPKSGVHFIADLLAHCRQTGARLASVVGRYYAMDRDKRWERVKKAYDLLVHGIGQPVHDPLAAIQASYEEGITDEFLEPMVCVDEQNRPLACIQPEDAVCCFNFRTDRGRQITMALTQQDFLDYAMYKMPLFYVTMTPYDDTFEGVKVIFEKDNIQNSLGEVIAKAGLKQIRIAETEKYPHVTFFFSGGREEPFEGEKRILCPSPKVPTYDLKPEMSAYEVRDAIIEELAKEEAHFICLNFANPDMVGHTGVFEAAVKACEVVDECTKAVVEVALKHGYTPLIIADHGNAEYMINEDGSPNTAHTTNLVPCVLVDENFKGTLKDGILGNVAPTILDLMGLEAPEEMTESSLLEKEVVS
ncbi:2,3-bisphosphoglycerate-independent phosphoglycerate mutase [Thermonema lapsum]|uniref:2,3-bisphosphoglycerate-independent phosphoglycerate mutase n=1 Tax=Thermonema lapsum TaxID=28195 RepID=A0A846MS86_9BACT|nr:2,3-bisphosphoglycerate-independent phosphoglycerate mutase [Thermonema lapsum]NIK74325.1 2,3-bisphosphoglycerate-independent phosphoglycerate mutase [Thermonema lapsum]